MKNLSIKSQIFNEIASASKAVKTSFDLENFDAWMTSAQFFSEGLKDDSFALFVTKAYNSAKEHGRESTFVAFLYAVTGKSDGTIDGRTFMSAIASAMSKTKKSIVTVLSFGGELPKTEKDEKIIAKNGRANKLANCFEQLLDLDVLADVTK